MEKEPITVNGLEKLKEEGMLSLIYYMTEALFLDLTQAVILRQF